LGDGLTIKKVDLNLFKVFEAVLRHRGVSAASRELAVTPSAISHALSRLRLALGDELFVSGDTGMEPTPRARELAPSIRDGLERFSLAVGARPFIPAEAGRTFRIAATDHTSITILPHLVGRMATKAPHANLRVFPVGRLDVVRELDEGRLDLVIGWFRDLPDRMQRTIITEEYETIVVRAGHPLTQGEVTRQRLLAFPHIVVELTGSGDDGVDGFLDDRGVLRRVWIERLLIETDGTDDGPVGRVAVTVPHYGAVAPMLLVTDMVATLPRRLAKVVGERGTLVPVDLPYEPSVVAIEAVWHQRSDGDQGIQWLITELTQAMNSLD
jgi:DNA-binding transcriptional LysR family regulator